MSSVEGRISIDPSVREDVTLVPVPKDCIGYVMGDKQGAQLSSRSAQGSFRLAYDPCQAEDLEPPGRGARSSSRLACSFRSDAVLWVQHDLRQGIQVFTRALSMSSMFESSG